MEETVRERRAGAGRRPGRGRGARGRRGVSSGFIRALDSALCRPVPLQVTAGQLRERGNALFQAGDHAAALAAYTQALSLCQAEPERAVLHRNRAACYLKLVRAGGGGERAGSDLPGRWGGIGWARLCAALPGSPRNGQSSFCAYFFGPVGGWCSAPPAGCCLCQGVRGPRACSSGSPESLVSCRGAVCG